MSIRSGATVREKRVSNGQYRIGIYCRVSTEEQAENPEGSLRNQEQRLRHAVIDRNHHQNGRFGEVVDVFIDRARSGKDTNRPELQRLLAAIQEGEINLVMVTELSRFSRSIKDFSEMWELMRKHQCAFLSLSDNYDTSTPAGEMIIYSMMNFAQFERKQTALRIANGFAARAKRGLYNGGPVPLGYELDPERKGYFKVSDKDAETVRRAFELFLELKGLSRTARRLNEEGRHYTRLTAGGKSKLGYFTVGNLQYLLRNKAYIGIRVFTERGGEKNETQASWPAIVHPALFKQTQEILTANHRRTKPAQEERFPYILSGLVYCGACGDVLCGKSAHGNGGKIPYYEHGWACRKQSCMVDKVHFCKSLMRVQARILEPIVWEKTLEFLSRPAVREALLTEARKTFEQTGPKAEIDKTRKKVQALALQLEALAERLAILPSSVSPAPVFKQMEKLEQAKADEEKRLLELQGGEIGRCGEKVVGWEEYEELIGTLRKRLSGKGDALPEARREIIRHLVSKVEIFQEGVKVHFKVGKGYVLEALEVEKKARPPVEESGFFSSNFGSKTLQNGGSSRD